MKRTIRYGVQIEFTTDPDVTRADARRFVREAMEWRERQWPGLTRNLRVKYVHEAASTQEEK